MKVKKRISREKGGNFLKSVDQVLTKNSHDARKTNRPEGQRGESTMKRFSEYSFKDPVFCLEDIRTFKCELIDQLAVAIDDYLYDGVDSREMSANDLRIIAFLYGIREKAAEITEIMEKLDRELGEMGVGLYKKCKHLNRRENHNRELEARRDKES
ncbi:MAG: hypothetical protein AB1558_08605 [Thermodesulfobacteriota bacterium]